MIPARIHLSPSAFKRRVVTALVACVAGVGVWACSLNPQPIPPGFNDQPGASDAGRGADVTVGPVSGGGDGGAGVDSDGAPSPQDGGDAGDAGSDAPSDATDGGDG